MGHIILRIFYEEGSRAKGNIKRMKKAPKVHRILKLFFSFYLFYLFYILDEGFIKEYV